MALCRILNDDNQPQAALYDNGRVCLLEGAPNDCSLFDLANRQFSSVPQDANWQPAPGKFLPPVPTPEKVICIGLNYRDHAIETGSEIPSEPVVFNKFVSTIIGDQDAIVLPKVSDQVDYEAELVVVIGKGGKHISKASAMDHVFGYTCGHDVSARDWQKGRPGGQWLLGKTFDTFAPIGPWVVTKDEMPDPSDVRVQLILNGETMQDSTTAQLIFDIPELIEHVSKICKLQPGDLIFTGTPPGVGAARKPPVFLKPGDICEVKIDGIGTLTNPCVAE
ncbi:UNVERIFIED_CONTAM: hypothetical protein GTU68_027399 [Idotea baltica]|uniref:Ureidoglycolate lyase n=1 Tax=Stieleria marina TaxID=1930275 RepID=A0A517NSH1_9BACT|nr:hypothetical protein [Idotea baltica]QDT10055.1 Ureidoglycolate lyase [Planctomycetes bacterium K23_9]